MTRHQQRANRARRSIFFHEAQIFGEDQAKIEVRKDPSSAAVDLLTDVRHWAQKIGLDFQNLVDRSDNHFRVEKDEQ